MEDSEVPVVHYLAPLLNAAPRPDGERDAAMILQSAAASWIGGSSCPQHSLTKSNRQYMYIRIRIFPVAFARY